MNPQEIAALEARAGLDARLAAANAEVESWKAHHERIDGELAAAQGRLEAAQVELAELEQEQGEEED